MNFWSILNYIVYCWLSRLSTARVPYPRFSLVDPIKLGLVKSLTKMVPGCLRTIKVAKYAFLSQKSIFIKI